MESSGCSRRAEHDGVPAGPSDNGDVRIRCAFRRALGAVPELRAYSIYREHRPWPTRKAGVSRPSIWEGGGGAFGLVAGLARNVRYTFLFLVSMPGTAPSVLAVVDVERGRADARAWSSIVLVITDTRQALCCR